jgi:hypothetical protein
VGHEKHLIIILTMIINIPPSSSRYIDHQWSNQDPLQHLLGASVPRLVDVGPTPTPSRGGTLVAKAVLERVPHGQPGSTWRSGYRPGVARPHRIPSTEGVRRVPLWLLLARVSIGQGPEDGVPAGDVEVMMLLQLLG